ncbi:MAG: carboxypeptidase regulatory-like domain-containing protein [Nitrososphaerota archaeon]|nr:carboxypeptidase regulatory-like domain-containing protein [Nitrososphaerota archaeon]
MRDRLLLLVALTLLAVPAAAFSQPAASTSVPPPPIGIGFGPLSIIPASVGTPVFAPGDSLWVQSNDSSSVLFLSLRAPNGTSTPNYYLEPGGLISLHTFGSGDQAGGWTISTTIATTGETGNATVTLAKPTLALVPAFANATLSDNSLSLGYTVPSTAAYNIQACTMGSGATDRTDYQLPGDIGGTLEVSVSGNTVSVNTPPALSQFSVWVELYALRTYDEGSAMVSASTLAAQTQVLSAGSGQESQNASLTDELHLRVGRYDMRTFVRGPSGLTSYDTQLVHTSQASWVSLEGCTQLSAVTGGSFSMVSNMDGGNSTWPRFLYTMYDDGGVGNFTISKVPVSEARVDVRSAAQGRRLVGTTMTASGTGISSWDSFDSGIYIVGTKFPLNVTVRIDFEGVTSEEFSALIASPFASVPLLVQVGTLDVLTTTGGRPAANATLDVTAGPLLDPNQPVYKTGEAGTFIYNLPPGDYTVSASGSGRTASATGLVVSGGATNLSIEVGTQPPPYLLYLTAVVLVVAVGLNVVFWRSYLERKDVFNRLPPS